MARDANSSPDNEFSYVHRVVPPMEGHEVCGLESSRVKVKTKDIIDKNPNFELSEQVMRNK